MPKPFCSKNKSKPCKNVLVSIYFFQHFFCKNCFLENFAFWSTAFGPMVFLLVSICFFQQNHKPPKTLTKMCTEILIGFDLFQRFYAGLANFVNSKPMRFTLVLIWIFHKTHVTCAESKYIACMAKIHATYTTFTTYVHTKNSCLCNELLINNSCPQPQIDIVTGANAHCQLCPFADGNLHLLWQSPSRGFWVYYLSEVYQELSKDVLCTNHQSQVMLRSNVKNLKPQMLFMFISRNASISQQITIFENSVCQPMGITVNTTDNFKIIEI